MCIIRWLWAHLEVQTGAIWNLIHMLDGLCGVQSKLQSRTLNNKFILRINM